MPASGYRSYNNGSLNNEGSNGYYWSSSVYNADNGYDCYFNSGGINPEDYNNRSYGFSVRCVQVFATLLLLTQSRMAIGRQLLEI